MVAIKNHDDDDDDDGGSVQLAKRTIMLVVTAATWTVNRSRYESLQIRSVQNQPSKALTVLSKFYQF